MERSLPIGHGINLPVLSISKWYKIVEQGNITLNLLHPSRLNPELSAYAQLFGAFNYQKNPLPPPDMKVLVHVLPI